MPRPWTLAASAALIALAFIACGGSRSGSPSVSQSAAGDGGAGAAGAGAALAGGNAGLGGSAGPAKAGGGGQAAGESPGGSAAGGSVAAAGSSSAAGMPGSAGAQANGGGTGWIVPAEPGAGWNGPQDSACPSAAVASNAACASPPGTRCSYPESGSTYTLRCQCYTSSTGAGRWWCDHHSSIGYDLCPVAYPGDGSCPNIGDFTCVYVDDQDKLKACNCALGTAKCFPWGL